MKIRTGFVTNSSSTNFLIMSKEELTPEFLFRKLGFKKGSIIERQAMELCENIVDGTKRGPNYYDVSEFDKETINRFFGFDTSEKFEKYKKKGFFSYIGYTNSDDSTLTGFFTTDTFEIEQKGFYLNGRNCIW